MWITHRTPGPQLSLNYHSALWEEGQQAGGVDGDNVRTRNEVEEAERRRETKGMLNVVGEEIIRSQLIQWRAFTAGC